jgi:hypothetical protein
VENEFSYLDRPPVGMANPRDVAHTMAKFRRANKLSKESDIMFAAAQIARFHGCPAVDNACSLLARSLADDAEKARRPVKDVPIKSENQEIL